VHDAAGGGPHSNSPSSKSHKAPDERDEQDGAVAVSGVEALAPLKCTPNPVVSGAGAILVRYNFPPAALSQLSRSLMGLAEVRTMPLSPSDSPHQTHLHAWGSLRFQETCLSILLLWPCPELHCKICDTCVYQASCHCVQSSSSCCTLPLCISL
jgi:hypothetical protein